MKSKNQFKKGDKVFLKSGCPTMVVDQIFIDPINSKFEKIGCIWFVGNELKRDVFHFASLEYELRNFKTTLQNLVDNDSFCRDIVNLIEE